MSVPTQCSAAQLPAVLGWSSPANGTTVLVPPWSFRAIIMFHQYSRVVSVSFQCNTFRASALAAHVAAELAVSDARALYYACGVRSSAQSHLEPSSASSAALLNWSPYCRRRWLHSLCKQATVGTMHGRRELSPAYWSRFRPYTRRNRAALLLRSACRGCAAPPPASPALRPLR